MELRDKIKEATSKVLGSDSGVEFYQTTDKEKTDWEKVE
jgi:hypothetical protein